MLRQMPYFYRTTSGARSTAAQKYLHMKSFKFGKRSIAADPETMTNTHTWSLLLRLLQDIPFIPLACGLFFPWTGHIVTTSYIIFFQAVRRCHDLFCG